LLRDGGVECGLGCGIRAVVVGCRLYFLCLLGDGDGMGWDGIGRVDEGWRDGGMEI
jgi:hypothetical protein